MATGDRGLLLSLWRFARPHRAQFAVAAAVLVASFGIEILGPWLIRCAIDGPLAAAVSGDGSHIGTLTRYAVAYLATVIIGSGLGYAFAVLAATGGQRTVRDIRTSLFEHALQLDLRWHDRHPPGQLVTRVTTDVQNLDELVSSGVLRALFDLAKIVGILTALFFVNGTVALFVLAATPIAIAVSVGFRGRARAAYRDVRFALGVQNAFTAEIVDGARTTRAFGRESDIDARYDEHNRTTRTAWNRAIVAFASFFATVDGTLRLGQAGLLWLGGSAVLDGSMTAGSLVQVWLYFAKLIRPIRELGEKYNLVQAALASAERVLHVLRERPAPPEPTSPRAVGHGPAHLGFYAVEFAYRADAPVLRGIDLEVPAGTTCAVVGPTGAGKSSLMALVARLYDPDRGRVTLDDVPLTELRLADVRTRVVSVPQEPFLFSGTLLDNVRLFDRSIPAGRVSAALDALGAAALVDAREGGLEATLGPRGTTLSLGERQLVAFARAMVAEPDVLLLDEATANVDSQTEARIQHALESLTRGRTTIVVAHRLSTVRRADQIVVLDAGRIVERGRHDELVTRGGRYARMLRGLD